MAGCILPFRDAVRQVDRSVVALEQFTEKGLSKRRSVSEKGHLADMSDPRRMSASSRIVLQNSD